MKTLNKTTKRAKQFLNTYFNSNCYTLRDMYSSYSSDKEHAYNWCINRMHEFKGYDFRMLSANSFYFTCAFHCTIDNKEYVVVETANNEYKIEL